MATIDVRNPATGETVGSVRCSDTNDLESAVEHGRKAQRDWAAMRLSKRAAVLRRFHDAVLDHSERILDVIQAETGKSRRDAFAEIVSVAGTARYYLAHGAEHLSGKHREGAFPLVTDSEIAYKPHGLVGLISPWNYPFLLAIGDAIPALLAGNAVIVKPSELTPLSADLARELFIKAGLDPRLLTVLHGWGEAGSRLIGHVDYVGFTGSTATGRKVALAAAERLIPFSLELGGKNPMIVLEGTLLDNAASGFIAGAFANAGQACIAVERIYVQESIFDEYCSRIVEKTSALKIGWSKSWDIDIGSLISPAHADKVAGHVEQAKDLGANTLSGGRRRPDLGPAFMEPTILTGVPESTKLFSEETFGPVAAIYPVRDEEDAISLANDSAFGLNASVWTGEERRSERIARRLDTGSVSINSTLLIYNSFDVPMGGVKLSGIGRRHGEHGIRRYTQAQGIVSSIETGGGYDSLLTRLDRQSRAGLILKALRLWRRI